MVSTAFVLSGGGNLGAVQVGMLRALFEAGIRPDIIVGTSVGAFKVSPTDFSQADRLITDSYALTTAWLADPTSAMGDPLAPHDHHLRP